MLNLVGKEELGNVFSKKYPLSKLNVHSNQKKERKKIISYSRCKLKKKSESIIYTWVLVSLIDKFF